MFGLIKKIVGTKNDREVKRIRPYVVAINALEDDFQKRISEATEESRSALEEAQAAASAADIEEREELKSRAEEADKALREAENNVLQEILPQAFAAVREASRRTIGLRHFDVQLIGGAFLHEGKIGEMKTGEGKTLVATLALYLNALTGRGAHLITVK